MLLLLELVVQVEVLDLLRINAIDEEYPAVVRHLSLFADDGRREAIYSILGTSLVFLRLCDTLWEVGVGVFISSSIARNFFCRTMNGKEVGSPVSLV